MPARRISARLYRWLVGEVNLWRDEGLIAGEQAQQILALYEAEKAGASLGIPVSAVFSGLGGVLLALASLLLIHAVRDVVSGETRLILIWSGFLTWHILALLTLGAGPLKQALREGIFLAGSVYLGGAVFLIPQIFLREMFPIWGIYAWAAGIWGLAFLAEGTFALQILLTYSLLFVGLFRSANSVDFDSVFSRWSPEAHGTVAALYLLLVVPLLVLTLRRREELAGIFGVGAVAAWLLLAIPPEFEGYNGLRISAMMAAVGCLVWLYGEAFAPEGLFKTGMVIGGGLLSLPGWGILNARTLYDHPGGELIHTPLVLLRPGIIIALMLVALLGPLFSERLRSVPHVRVSRLIRGVLGPAFCVAVALSIYFLTLVELLGFDLRVVCLILAVAGMGVLALWDTITGLARGNLLQAALGLFAILLVVFVWWANFFGYSELVGALLFAVAGALLGAGALIWIRVRARRQVPAAPGSAMKNSPGLSPEDINPLGTPESLPEDKKSASWRAYLLVMLFQTLLLGAITWGATNGWFPEPHQY